MISERQGARRDQKKAEMDRQIALSGYIIDGVSEIVAEQKVDKTIDSYRSQYNSEILGRKYFASCPVFELFEDFGSLIAQQDRYGRYNFRQRAGGRIQGSQEFSFDRPARLFVLSAALQPDPETEN